MTDDYLAGNARLRARRAQLLGPAELDRLAELPTDRVLAELATAGYGVAIEQARLTDGDPEETLEAAVTVRLRDSLSAVADIYHGTAGDVVGVLLQRWDLRDVRTVLRAVVRDPAAGPDGPGAPVVVGVGRMTAPLAAELTEPSDPDARPHLPAVLDQLAAAGLPGPESSWSLRAIGRDFALHRDPAELDRAVTAAAVTGWRQVIARAGRAAGAVAGLVRAELDAANLILALRLRSRLPEGWQESRSADGARLVERYLLPCGSLPVPTLAEVADGRVDPVWVAPRAWGPAVERWQRTGDLTVLADELADAVRRTVLAGWLNDPFGAGVPVAYVTAVEAEARALRSLARARAGQRAVPLEAA